MSKKNKKKSTFKMEVDVDGTNISAELQNNKLTIEIDGVEELAEELLNHWGELAVLYDMFIARRRMD